MSVYGYERPVEEGEIGTGPQYGLVIVSECETAIREPTAGDVVGFCWGGEAYCMVRHFKHHQLDLGACKRGT